MGTAEDPERLIAEALRAQAARTPLPAAETAPVQPGHGLASSGGYGLLSGSDLALALHTGQPHDPTIALSSRPVATTRIEPAHRVSVAMVLLFAVLLGLAAGAVVGLLTLL